MLQKKKIIRYLETRQEKSIFDELLLLYISGDLHTILKSWGLRHASIHIEWKPDCKMVDVQATYFNYFYEWQFDENECSFMIYEDDEPDVPTCLAYSSFDGIHGLLSKMESMVPRIS